MKLFQLLVCLLIMGLPTAVSAQQPAWPNSTVRLVVPYPAASSGDLIARKFLPIISQKLGGTFYIDNRTGANGNLGMKAVKDSTPDGTTFAVASDIQFTAAPAMYVNLPYDPENDFTAVAPFARMPLVVVAPVGLKANNLVELIALAKAQPGQLAYASIGVGSTHQLHVELLKIRGGFDMLHVPYKGTAQATPDLISSQVQMMFFGVPQALALVKTGQLKVLAVGTRERLPELPNVPTIAESGFPGFEAVSIWGVWAPAKTPASIVRRFGDSITEALADNDIRQWYRSSVLSTIDGGNDEMMTMLRRQRAIWQETVKAANIEPIP